MNVGILVSENQNVLPKISVSSLLSCSPDACGYLFFFRVLLKMGSDGSHFNVSLIVTEKAKVTRQCPQTTTVGLPVVG